MKPENPENLDELIPTRSSLLGRLVNWDDQESWREFFNTYWKLIYSVALKAGLTEDEAEEVVQETVITAAKRRPRALNQRPSCRHCCCPSGLSWS